MTTCNLEIDLLKRSQELAPGPPTELLANLYASVLLNSEPGAPHPWEPFNNPGIAAQVKNELQSSSDAALLGSVAQHVYATEAATNSGAADIGALRTLATELVTRAHMLDPQNREWSTLMEGVKGLPPGSLAPVAQAAPAQTTAARSATTPAPAIRVGGAIQAQNLVEAPAPIYPPLAKAAKVQGTVMLQIRIGTDGHVTDATLISGHPLLVNAAIDAAKLYIYKPTMLNNHPTEVLTDVEIVFPPAKP